MPTKLTSKRSKFGLRFFVGWRYQKTRNLIDNDVTDFEHISGEYNFLIFLLTKAYLVSSV